MSVTVSYQIYVGTAAPKYNVFRIFKQISPGTALATDMVAAKLLSTYRLHYSSLLTEEC
jgi:hypothetical protein